MKKTSLTALYNILVFVIIAFAQPLMSQTVTPLPANSLLLSNSSAPAILLTKNILPFSFSSKYSSLPQLRQFMDSSTLAEFPTAYCTADLAFFCRLEVKLEKATKIPVRFRIGDVQQVDYLEGKFEGWRYGH